MPRSNINDRTVVDRFHQAFERWQNMLGPDPISDRMIEERGLVIETMRLARAFRSAPGDLYDRAHKNLANKLYELIQRVPQTPSKVEFPAEAFKIVLEESATKPSLEEAQAFAKQWMEYMMKVQTPEGTLESYFQYIDEQVKFAYPVKVNSG